MDQRVGPGLAQLLWALFGLRPLLRLAIPVSPAVAVSWRCRGSRLELTHKRFGQLVPMPARVADSVAHVCKSGQDQVKQAEQDEEP